MGAPGSVSLNQPCNNGCRNDRIGKVRARRNTVGKHAGTGQGARAAAVLAGASATPWRLHLRLHYHQLINVLLTRKCPRSQQPIDQLGHLYLQYLQPAGLQVVPQPKLLQAGLERLLGGSVLALEPAGVFAQGGQVD